MIPSSPTSQYGKENEKKMMGKVGNWKIQSRRGNLLSKTSPRGFKILLFYKNRVNQGLNMKLKVGIWWLWIYDIPNLIVFNKSSLTLRLNMWGNKKMINWVKHKRNVKKVIQCLCCWFFMCFLSKASLTKWNEINAVLTASLRHERLD